MNRIPIKKAKQIREDLGATHLVIFAIDAEGQQHVVTHGDTRQHSWSAASAGNKLKAALGWPKNLCQETPLPRECKNCAYYKPDYGTHCFNGWTGDGSNGICMYEPARVAVTHRETCGHFEPK